MSGERTAHWVIVALLCLTAGFYARHLIEPSEKPAETAVKIAFVTALSSGDDFWKIVIAGARDAAADYGVDLTVFEPHDSEDDSQTSMISSIDPAEFDGVAVSPMSPINQTRMLSRLATQTYLVTYDNDAPLSLRHCYVGTNNTSAGRLCGRLVKEALPGGGRVAVFIGDLSRDNARLRRNSLMEELMDGGEAGLDNEYLADQEVSRGGFEIVKTYLDGSNPAKAKQNAASALKDYPQLDGLIGLYGYNGPAILEAVTEAGKIGQVKIIAFDEFEKTLQGVADNAIHATVLQDPYQYGYESVRMLHSLTSKAFYAEEAMGRGSMYFPCAVLRKNDIDKYQKKLASRLKAVNDQQQPTK